MQHAVRRRQRPLHAELNRHQHPPRAGDDRRRTTHRGCAMTIVRLVCLRVLALAVTGCGGGGVAVTGTVTRGGQPLEAGVIAFEPVPGSGTTGPGASMTFEDGTFALEESKKLLPGRYVVRVCPVPLHSGTDL